MGYLNQPPLGLPDREMIRHDALNAGGVDPVVLLFRIVEYRKSSGKLVGVPVEEAGFDAAVEIVTALIRTNSDSRFSLEAVGFLQ